MALDKLLARLGRGGRTLRFVYEAGPCGYGVYRHLRDHGHDCVVVAPSLIPRKPGERIKTDRRDATALARLHRAGELTLVWVPDPEHEAMRDLAHSASFHAWEKTAPSNPGIKHLTAKSGPPRPQQLRLAKIESRCPWSGFSPQLVRAAVPVHLIHMLEGK